MEKKSQIMENLRAVYEYAFIETAPYGFFVPKADAYEAVALAHKNCRCLHCGSELAAAYRKNGPVYFSKERFAAQRALYAKLKLPFPTAAEPFVYRAEGYCASCAPQCCGDAAGQKLYTLCLELYRRDEAVLEESRRLLETQLKAWLRRIVSAAQVASYDLSSYEALQGVVRAAVLADLRVLEGAVAAYRDVVDATRVQAETLLAALPAVWEAWVARPMAMYDAFSDAQQNEYTIAFVAEGAPCEDFYLRRKLEGARVRMFLEQRRARSAEELAAEAGVPDAWVNLLMDHLMALES